jgi:hypothetical protein
LLKQLPLDDAEFLGKRTSRGLGYDEAAFAKPLAIDQETLRLACTTRLARLGRRLGLWSRFRLGGAVDDLIGTEVECFGLGRGSCLRRRRGTVAGRPESVPWKS